MRKVRRIKPKAKIKSTIKPNSKTKKSFSIRIGRCCGGRKR